VFEDIRSSALTYIPTWVYADAFLASILGSFCRSANLIYCNRKPFSWLSSLSQRFLDFYAFRSRNVSRFFGLGAIDPQTAHNSLKTAVRRMGKNRKQLSLAADKTGKTFVHLLLLLFCFAVYPFCRIMCVSSERWWVQQLIANACEAKSKENL